MMDFLTNLNPVWLAFLATLFTYGVTALGSALVFFFKKVNKNVLDAMLGFAAGVMIAASFWSLLSPAIEMAESLNMIPWIITFIGFFSGGVLLYIGDKLFNFFNNRFSKKTNKDNNKVNSFKRCLMLILSITLHNIPEGLAVGVAFGSVIYNLNGALTLAIGIAMQNLPEGAILSMPLKSEGMSKPKAFLMGTLSGIVEPIASIITILLARFVTPILPYLLS